LQIVLLAVAVHACAGYDPPHRIMKSSVTIREMRQDDRQEVSQLLKQLGYPTSPEQVLDRFNRFGRDRHRLFVVEVSGRIVGWAHAELRYALASEPRVEIMAMVVDESFRSQGLGRALLQRIEAWGREAGVKIVRVTSNLARTDSHAFYQRAGYVLQKHSAVYAKPLSEVERSSLKY
jgi:GNAT superfamily N-acetyltransferase